ncbi:uncharacterized protein DUF4250 [Hypnocyclicus thermotrophus]|uniref:Uncharacterized protein DUF4250 n=1 Tax=Hypnocyclicus thermotrophus TaxID=1627895 RepID=A0AA46DZ39_9FUSO|nr:DUF4250 domain-containing protein [Hypnocyclicus thermotrophus]TDT71376.1 uncharacterized protein DUF4250 [Hypnocyclicus thermotrophus]
MELKNFKTMDINILFSIINMKLRDEFDSLEELVKYYDIDQKELEDKLNEAGYHYESNHNHFTKV